MGVADVLAVVRNGAAFVGHAAPDAHRRAAFATLARHALRVEQRAVNRQRRIESRLLSLHCPSLDLKR